MFSRTIILRILILGITIFPVLFITYSCVTPSILATQSVQMGDRANNENNYDLAIQHYQTYLETAPSLGTMRNRLMEADICRKLAHCYSLQGSYQRAAEYLSQALVIDKQEQDNILNIIEDYRLLGIGKIYTGNYDSALYYLDIALQMNEGMESSLKAVKKLSIADTHLSRAQLELSMGLFKASLDDVENAVKIYEKEDNLFGQMESYLVLAKLSVATNKIDLAQEYIVRSIDAAKEEGYKLYRQYQVLADIALNLGLPEEAVLSRLEALAEARESNIIPQVIWACLRLGDAYNELGDVKKANQYYHEARSLQDQVDQSSALAPSVQMRLGDLQNAYDLFNASGGSLGVHIAGLKLLEENLLGNDSDTAVAILNKSIDYFKEQGIIEGIGKSMIMLSVVEKNKGDYQAALLTLDQAGDLPLRPELAWKVEYNRALVYQQSGDILSARQNLNQALAIIEKQRNTITLPAFKWHYLDKKTDVYDTYINLLLAPANVNQEDIAKSFEINERARSRTFLDMLLEQNIVSTDPVISQQFALIKENQQLIKIAAEQGLKGIVVDNLEESIQANELKLSELANSGTNLSLAILGTAELVTLSDLQSQLDERSAILELWSGRNYLVSWKITRDNISYSRTPIANAELHKSVARVRNLIKFGIETRIISGFSDLYGLLEPAVQNVFEEKRNVVVIPHGPLHFIPFEALYDGRKFVLEKSTLHYAPSASVYQYTTSKSVAKKQKNLLGMALGELEIEGHSGLPGTTMEVSQLAQFYPDNNCAYEEEVSESFFKDYARNYGLIHVATHGVFNRNKPGRSYILMTPTEEDDGKLMVNEIYDLNLNARMVALSACETGLGELSEGDELVGLSRAFIYAGTSSIIVSLWKVDDLSTSILMTRLHQLVKGGVSPYEALAIAKRDLLKANFNPANINNRTSNNLYPETLGSTTGVNQSLRNVRGPEAINWHPDLLHIVHSEESIHTSPYYWAPFIIIGGRSEN